MDVSLDARTMEWVQREKKNLSVELKPLFSGGVSYPVRDVYQLFVTNIPLEMTQVQKSHMNVSTGRHTKTGPGQSQRQT